MTGLPSRKARLVFSPRQWDIIELLRRELTQKAIAAKLGISPSTVEEQLARARRRAGVRTTSRLLARAGARPRLVQPAAVPILPDMEIST